MPLDARVQSYIEIDAKLNQNLGKMILILVTKSGLKNFPAMESF